MRDLAHRDGSVLGQRAVGGHGDPECLQRVAAWAPVLAVTATEPDERLDLGSVRLSEPVWERRVGVDGSTRTVRIGGSQGVLSVHPAHTESREPITSVRWSYPSGFALAP